MDKTLLIAIHFSRETVNWARRQYRNRAVVVLAFHEAPQEAAWPADWEHWPAAEWLDQDSVRRDFLAFLDDWPRQALVDGKTFEDLFRRRGGYSLWWTGPAIDRHPVLGPFAALKTLWICNRAIQAVAPGQVAISVSDRDLAWSLASRCRRAACPYEFLPGSARPARSPWRGRLRWLFAAVLHVCLRPGILLLRSLLARMVAPTPPETPALRDLPAVVYASPLFRMFRLDERPVAGDFWKELCEALRRQEPQLRHRFLLRVSGSFPGYRSIGGVYHTAWRLLRHLPGAAPLRERYVNWTQLVGTLPSSLGSLFRYWRLERLPAFRRSFTFANADVAPFYLPRLRKTVCGIGGWEHAVGASAAVFRAIGNVRALLVYGEMYPDAQTEIAAARMLGIPTIGVQHGTIYPMHLIYTLPPGQIRGAPVPDYFAAYGEFAKETLSVHGAYPAERVWLTGGARFDRLVNEPIPSAVARGQLGLPADKKIIFFASTNYAITRESAEELFRAAKQRPDWLVCVKRHPNDVPLAAYRRLAGGIGAESVRFFDESYEELLAACDVLVSTCSTSILEAAILGRRTICVDAPGLGELYPYAAEGGALGARTAADLPAAVEKALSPEGQRELDARRQEFLNRHAGPAAEGRAATVLADKILALCGLSGGGNPMVY